MITLDSNVIVTGVAGEVWTLTEIMPWCPAECCVWWSSDRVTQVSRYSIRMCSLEFISSLGMLATQLSHWLLLQTKPTIFRVYYSLFNIQTGHFQWQPQTGLSSEIIWLWFWSVNMMLSLNKLKSLKVANWRKDEWEMKNDEWW